MKKWALITGATGGMGRAYIKEMITRDYNLVLVGRNIEKMNVLKDELNLNDSSLYRFILADLTLEEDINNLFKKVSLWNIKFSFILNVAGIENEDWFSNVSLADTQNIIKTNVLATTHIIKESLNFKADKMYILNVSSMAGFFPIPMKAVYASTKRYLIEITRILNYELKDQNVFLSVVCPAGMPTKELIKRKIESQGFFGNITTLDTEVVVKRSINKTLKNKVVYVPGGLNSLLLKLSHLVPRNILLKILGQRWKKTTKKMKK